MSSPDFALQWLNYQEIKIYNKGRRILEYNGDPDYEISPLDTKIRVGVELEEEPENSEEVYDEMPFQEFERLRFAIFSGTNPAYFWKLRQQCYYYIGRKRSNSLGMTYDNFRKQGIRIQHDAKKRRLRIMGKNVLADPSIGRQDAEVSPWFVYDDDSPVSGERYAGSMKMNRMFGRTQEDNVKYAEIKEIPVLITKDKYIVCIPHEDSPQRIICTGAPRTGKSTFTNSFIQSVFHQWNERCGWMLDSQNQFCKMSLPQDYETFNSINRLLNRHPRPSPVLLLYLACNSPSLITYPNISMKLTLNFLEFLNKYSFYTYGVKDWQLEATESYVKQFHYQMKDVRNSDELKDLFYEMIPEANDQKKGDDKRKMIAKWVSKFHSIFMDNFTSNLYQDDDMATDELEIIMPDGTTMKGHPFIMAAEACLIPIINTSTVPDKKWVRNYQADLMRKILQHQKIRKSLGKLHRIWVDVDEMQKIYEEKSGRGMDNASQAFETMFREGGFNGIGFAGNTQSLEKMNPEMIKHATHIACTYTQSKKERTMIKDIFELPNETISEMGKLKLQEMMIFSTHPFVVYDRWGRRKVITDRKWFSGKIIPPVSHHEPPPS